MGSLILLLNNSNRNPQIKSSTFILKVPPTFESGSQNRILLLISPTIKKEISASSPKRFHSIPCPFVCRHLRSYSHASSTLVTGNVWPAFPCPRPLSARSPQTASCNLRFRLHLSIAATAHLPCHIRRHTLPAAPPCLHTIVVGRSSR